MSTESTESRDSAVSAPIRQLIDVFSRQLPEVAFPGVSAASLTEQAATLESTAKALASAEQAMAVARQAHADAHAELKRSAELGIGYAKVYASEDEALREQLEAIDLERSTRRKLPPKRKSRKRGKASNVAELPLESSRATG